MPRAEVPGKCLLETSNADARSPKRPKRMAEHRNHENRPVDGRDKNYRNEALGTGSESGFSTASLTAQGAGMNFGILVFDGVEELDFVGPWEVLKIWSKIADGPENCFIVGESQTAISCARGLSVNPQISFEDCPKLDYLLVPGGQGTRKEVQNRVLLEFVESQARHCQAVLSVCTGAFILHAAGLLADKKATTHWASLARLRALGNVEVMEKRFVRDGNIWTSAGVSAGIDLMLAFIASIAGDEVAGQVQFNSEYYPASTSYGGFELHPDAPAYLKRS